jgi:hypothetical protein
MFSNFYEIFCFLILVFCACLFSVTLQFGWNLIPCFPFPFGFVKFYFRSKLFFYWNSKPFLLDVLQWVKLNSSSTLCGSVIPFSFRFRLIQMSRFGRNFRHSDLLLFVQLKLWAKIPWLSLSVATFSKLYSANFKYGII